MEFVEDVATLDAVYGKAAAASLRKVAREITPLYRKWIMASRFCVVSTVGPDGTDGSPRGDDRPVVQELDAKTLLLPDWRGNNRMDTLRNIVADGRLSLMFLVPGSNNVVRVNGRGRVTLDDTLCARFAYQGKQPRSVVVIEVAEVYFQCARALMRAGLWGAAPAEGLPSAGELLAEQTGGEEGGTDYDRNWPGRAAESMW